jgi:hypothetical protein
MADSGGHWATLAEAQKLTMSTRIPGVIETDIKRNNPVSRLPVAQAAGTGLRIEWLREKTVAEDDVAPAAQGQNLVWSDSVDYTEVNSSLRYMYIQRKLDKYNQKIYGNINDYQAQELLECEKALVRKLGDKCIYGDETYGGTPTEFDGLHALVAEYGTPNSDTVRTNSDLNFDQEEEALSMLSMRTVLDAMKYGCDEIWVPPAIGIRFDAAFEEKGFAGLASGTAGSLSLITRTIGELGKPVLMYQGIPIIRTDYLAAEQTNTGTGATSNKRGKYASGTKNYSIMFVKYGNVMEKDPGICYAYGGTANAGDLYDLFMWERLENYNASGMRLDSYGTVLLGAPMALARIHDVTDAAIVV